MQLSWGMFGADAMRVRGVGLHLTQLKVKQLAEELSERGATKSGRKRALQLRLRALTDNCGSDRGRRGRCRTVNGCLVQGAPQAREKFDLSIRFDRI